MYIPMDNNEQNIAIMDSTTNKHSKQQLKKPSIVKIKDQFEFWSPF